MMRTSRFVLLAIAVAAFVCFVVSPARAVIIQYGDRMGTTVTYQDINESSPTDPGVPLFGAPSIFGDQLEFNPQLFDATTTGGGIDFTDGQLNFTICAKDGFVIDNFMIDEAGDYTVFGIGTDATAVSVSTPTFIEITEVDGVTITPVGLSTNMTFTPVQTGAPPDYDLVNEPGFGVIWQGKLMVDITQILVDNNVTFVGGATKVGVTLNNILTAVSEDQSSASISKKDFDVTITPNIPEPTTLALVGMSLFAFLFHRRRK